LSELGSHLEWTRRFKMVLGPLKDFLENEPDRFLVFLDRAWQVVRIGSEPAAPQAFHLLLSKGAFCIVFRHGSDFIGSNSLSSSFLFRSHFSFCSFCFHDCLFCIARNNPCFILRTRVFVYCVFGAAHSRGHGVVLWSFLSNSPYYFITGAVCCLKCSQKLTTCPQCRKTLLAVQTNLPAQWMLNLPVSRAVRALPVQCDLCKVDLSRDRIEVHSCLFWLLN